MGLLPLVVRVEPAVGVMMPGIAGARIQDPGQMAGHVGQVQEPEQVRVQVRRHRLVRLR